MLKMHNSKLLKFQVLLKSHLGECGRSYKEVIQGLLDENIDPEPFVIIATMRMFLNIPILVINPKLQKSPEPREEKSPTGW